MGVVMAQKQWIWQWCYGHVESDGDMDTIESVSVAQGWIRGHRRAGTVIKLAMAQK